MKILQITPRFPYPPDGGSKVDYLTFAKALSGKHEIDLVCFGEEGYDPILLKDYYRKIDVVPFQKTSMISGLMSTIPYTIYKYDQLDMHKKIAMISQQNKYDMVVIFQMHMAHYAKYFPNTPVILRKHNVDTVIMKRLYGIDRRLYVRWFAKHQLKKLIRFENESSRLFTRCVMITKEDEDELKKICGDVKTDIIPCGIDVDKQTTRDEKRVSKNIVSFIGSMDWLPTEDAVYYFIKDIWSRIISKIPDAKFYMIGNPPTERVLKLCKEPNIIITGYVKEVGSYLENTDVLVVPLRVGSGMRIKILEALNQGVPIVTTTVGVEGISAKHEQELFIADSPEEFARMVLRVLQNSQESQRLSQNGRALVQTQYSTEVVGKLWELLIAREVNDFQNNKIKRN